MEIKKDMVIYHKMKLIQNKRKTILSGFLNEKQGY